MVESSSKLPELTFATPLVDLLSTSDEHGKSHGILYKVMLHIVSTAGPAWYSVCYSPHCR